MLDDLRMILDGLQMIPDDLQMIPEDMQIIPVEEFEDTISLDAVHFVVGYLFEDHRSPVVMEIKSDDVTCSHLHVVRLTI